MRNFKEKYQIRTRYCCEKKGYDQRNGKFENHGYGYTLLPTQVTQEKSRVMIKSIWFMVSYLLFSIFGYGREEKMFYSNKASGIETLDVMQS